MSMRYQAAILTASYFPLKVPDAPTVGTATAGSGSISLAFTAPSNVGAGAITSYLVVVTDSSSGATFTNTGASSPIVVTGLTAGNTYTAKVAATNAFGTGPYSAASNSASPVVQGQQAYTTAGTFSWVAPTGVTSVSVVAVGSGGGGGSNIGGGGGTLGYKNNITVVPGNAYTVVVAARNSGSGTSSYFISTGTVNAPSGANSSTSLTPTYTGDGGGQGGGGGAYPNGGGGGAGGYAGNGGTGGNSGSAGSAGAGGGGGGGGGTTNPSLYLGAGAGGVGILGQGSNGSGGSSGNPGTGGSGGASGSGYLGGNYGGGEGGGGNTGTVGAVRIIWPGTSRSFPSTNTGDL